MQNILRPLVVIVVEIEQDGGGRTGGGRCYLKLKIKVIFLVWGRVVLVNLDMGRVYFYLTRLPLNFEGCLKEESNLFPKVLGTP